MDAARSKHLRLGCTPFWSCLPPFYGVLVPLPALLPAPQYGSHPESAAWGCRVLGNAVCECEQSPEFEGEEETRRAPGFIKKGGLGVVLQALGAHPGEVEVEANALRCFTMCLAIGQEQLRNGEVEEEEDAEGREEDEDEEERPRPIPAVYVSAPCRGCAKEPAAQPCCPCSWQQQAPPPPAAVLTTHPLCVLPPSVQRRIAADALPAVLSTLQKAAESDQPLARDVVVMAFKTVRYLAKVRRRRRRRRLSLRVLLPGHCVEACGGFAWRAPGPRGRC